MSKKIIYKLLILLCGIHLLSGCGGCNQGPRPQITFGPETVQYGNVIIEAQVDPNGTSVSEIRIEWGRRPSASNAVSVPATDFFENNALLDLASANPIQLPATQPFFGKYNFRFPGGGNPLNEGEIVDYQIRVSHSSPSGGTLFFWSQRQSFTYHQADVPGGEVPPPPPVGGGGGGNEECSEETKWISIHTGNGSIDNSGNSTSPSVSEDGNVIAFASPVAFDSNDTNNSDDIYIHDREEGETTRVSIHTGPGAIANNGGAKSPAISADGKVIVFVSPVGFDSNDTNDADDIYVHDLNTNQTTRVSIHTGSGSIANNGGAKTPAISADGNVIAFVSPIGFDSNDTNNAEDVYVHDRTANTTTRVSVHTGSGSIANNGGAKTPAISADGKVIAFVSTVGFDSNDTNNADDVYIHDRDANETTRVSIHTGSGSIANNGGSKTPTISGDGNVIAFVSPVGFDPNDTNNADDIYVHDLAEEETTRISIHTASGSIANNGGAKSPSISEDGNVVAFTSPVGFDSNDTNNADDVYIHDRDEEETLRVSIHTGAGSIVNNGGAKSPSISADGNVIAFASPVGFDSDDTNNADDVYIHCI